MTADPVSLSAWAAAALLITIAVTIGAAVVRAVREHRGRTAPYQTPHRRSRRPDTRAALRRPGGPPWRP